MKKLTYFLCAALLLCGCKKDTTHFFDETPEERMSARINELNSRLLEAEHGWKGALTTSAKGGYGFYMDFNASQNVIMVADLNNATATQSQNSTFRIKWVMNATLIFDTYNYINMLQDPSPASYGGAAGSGLQSDVEFEFVRSTPDSVFLKGFKYRNDFILVKATAEEKQRYLSSAFKDNIDGINDYFTVSQNNYINVAGINNKIEFVLDKSNKIAQLQFTDNDGKVVQIKGKYNFEDIGINFASGFTINGVTFVKGKLENGIFVLYANDGTRYEIKQNDIPILPMKTLFAYNGTYRELYIGSGLPAGITSGFNAVYQSSVTKFAAMSPKRTLVDVRFILANSTSATVTTRNNNGTTTFSAVATFKYTYEDGVLTLTNPTYDNNWTARAAQLIDIQNYFATGGPFRVDYVQSTNPNVTNIGGLYRVADNSSFFYGSLRK
ncbi:DUF4302 domain-containing protein [Parasegetibacter sp. NRK P23]|uniref:DUF4302 domain-containing protein n=1 Tax=Parasegetibacter sp. NRK P23 TaxID=2942999 RepID=UPI002042CC13|nr:DUF4302 domain-containing protein [Parasegetibacter sp. NRK P23]MCM5527719.1 DUF4302 domain-containing protein [Parasegetibacter sp. NRK P23]